MTKWEDCLGLAHQELYGRPMPPYIKMLKTEIMEVSKRAAEIFALEFKTYGIGVLLYGDVVGPSEGPVEKYLHSKTCETYSPEDLLNRFNQKQTIK